MNVVVKALALQVHPSVLFIYVVLSFVAWPSSMYTRSQKLVVVPSKSRSHKVDERE
jgi:hypothetical protein